MSSHIYHKRTYTLQKASPHFILPPPHVKLESDIQCLFQPFLHFIDQIKEQHECSDERTLIPDSKKKVDKGIPNPENTLATQITQIGSKIKLRWSAKEVGDAGWRPGWYAATVQKYCQETDMLTVTYASEPDETYDEELLPLLSKGAIKLLWSPM